jgi:hypothetical protein
MRPPTADRAVVMLRREVPEFEDRFVDLLELYGEDLTAEVVFMELADFVTGLLVTCGPPGTLDRCFSVADNVARTVPGGRELIAYGLLNGMPPAARSLAGPYLSSVTANLVERLEQGEAVDDDPSLGS